MRWLPVFLLIILVGCPTEYSSSDGKAVASHPWDLPSWEYPFPEPENGWGDKPGHPKSTSRSQPDVEESDTFDPALLPGSWLQLATSNPDGVTRRPMESMHRIDFTPNGKLVYHLINDGENTATSGTWEKTNPGMIRFTLGENEGAPFAFQMNGEDFFFFHSGNPPQGYWFARIPDVFSDTIKTNRFQTTFGELHLTDIVGNSFSGMVSGGDTDMEVAGIYNAGVILLDWVEPDSGNKGLGAFIVDIDWTQFDGVWWVNSFEAAPFGGEWTGTAGLPEPQPDV